MKRNLYLISFLFLGLSVLAFLKWQERVSAHQQAKNQQLFPLEDWITMTSPQLYLERKGADFYSEKKIKLDQKAIGDWLKELSSLKKIREFTTQEQKNMMSEFKSVAQIKIKTPTQIISYQFGLRSPFSDAFYVLQEVDQKRYLFLVQDTSPNPEIYQENDDYFESRYQRIITLLNFSNSSFFKR
ncbi:MAG: hypothetical protein KBD63_04620 [Bacteriovoracaceae bacterium]|nr:hypothetical protein [Bacteriovoracaceae bacterium]